MKNSIVVSPENIGLVLDRLNRTLPQYRQVRSQYAYTRSLKKANQMVRHDEWRDRPVSCPAYFLSQGIDVRPVQLPLDEKFHINPMRNIHNSWFPGELIKVHTRTDYTNMYNFLVLRIGDQVKFCGTNRVVVEQEARPGPDKCLVVLDLQ